MELLDTVKEALDEDVLVVESEQKSEMLLATGLVQNLDSDVSGRRCFLDGVAVIALVAEQRRHVE